MAILLFRVAIVSNRFEVSNDDPANHSTLALKALGFLFALLKVLGYDLLGRLPYVHNERTATGG